MEERNYKLSGGTSLALPVSDADKLIGAGDGTAALLYLYALRGGGSFSPQRAALDLKRTEAEIAKAAAALCELGLFCAGSTKPSVLLPADELPEYTAEDIVSRVSENGEFKAIVDETQRIMGHMLTGADLKILFGIYDYLHLPTEVIFLLINHCVEETREHLGPGKLPSLRTIEKEAYIWYNREILTLERAEDFLVRKRARSGALGDVRRLLQINGRNFSATERKYVEGWLDAGFDLETIALAYDRTVVKTGKLAWSYMDSILSSWHAKNLHTAEQVLKGDMPVRNGKPSVSGGSQPQAASKPRDDAELMRKLLNQSKKG